MDTISALQSGYNGISQGLNAANQNAALIAATTTDTQADVVTPLVNLLSVQYQIQAASKVIESSNTLLGTLLDIKV